MWLQEDADSWVSVVADTSNHTSNVADSFTLDLSQNNVLSSDQGIFALYMNLAFVNDTDYVQIAGVRLLLEHK